MNGWWQEECGGTCSQLPVRRNLRDDEASTLLDQGLGSAYLRKDDRLDLSRPKSSIYCISATHLQPVHPPDIGRGGTGYEFTYRRLHPAMPAFEVLRFEDYEMLETQFYIIGPYLLANFRLIQKRRFTTLCAFLEQRKPDDRHGPSDLVYDLTDTDSRNALDLFR